MKRIWKCWGHFKIFWKIWGKNINSRGSKCNKNFRFGPSRDFTKSRGKTIITKKGRTRTSHASRSDLSIKSHADSLFFFLFLFFPFSQTLSLSSSPSRPSLICSFPASIHHTCHASRARSRITALVGNHVARRWRMSPYARHAPLAFVEFKFVFGTVEHIFWPFSMILRLTFQALQDGTPGPRWNSPELWHVFPWRSWLSKQFAAKRWWIWTWNHQNINVLSEIFKTVYNMSMFSVVCKNHFFFGLIVKNASLTLSCFAWRANQNSELGSETTHRLISTLQIQWRSQVWQMSFR